MRNVFLNGLIRNLLENIYLCTYILIYKDDNTYIIITCAFMIIFIYWLLLFKGNGIPTGHIVHPMLLIIFRYEVEELFKTKMSFIYWPWDLAHVGGMPTQFKEG